MKFWPRSKSCCSLSVLLSRPNCRIGTLDASYFRMLGGKIPGGMRADGRLRHGRDLRHRQVDLRMRLKVDSNDGDAVVGLRLDVLDVVDRGGHAALEGRDDTLFHLVGRDAVVGPDDADHRDIDVREDIDRHGHDGRNPKQQNGDATSRRRYRGGGGLVVLSTYGAQAICL